MTQVDEEEVFEGTRTRNYQYKSTNTDAFIRTRVQILTHLAGLSDALRDGVL
jgi:hypothetical protein